MASVSDRSHSLSSNIDNKDIVLHFMHVKVRQ
jgi:hypothetical protein